MENYPDCLMACPLFEGIGESDLTGMLDCLGAYPRHCEKGEIILAEGENVRFLGVVLSGAVQIVRIGYDGSRSILSKLGPCDLFAEAFVCAGTHTMPVDVVAAERAGVLLLPAGKILHPCEHPCGFHHQMIYNLTRILATKNLAFHQRTEITAQRTTRDKLMTYLLLESKRAGSRSFTIPFDRQELADYLGVDRSGLSAQIGRLRREGVLSCTRSHFTIHTGADSVPSSALAPESDKFSKI